MNPGPRVSVVVPNYNGAAYLRETLASVQAQTYPSWELIVVDDGSTDASADIVRACAARDSRIRLLALDRNYGRPSIPRNFGIEAASGEFIAFLDADDLWHPQKLEIQLAFMEASGTRFISSAMRDFRNAESTRALAASTFDTPPAARKITHAALLRKNIIPTSSVVVDREIIRRHPFLRDPRYKAIEDYHCWLCIHQHEIACSYKLAPELVYYRRTKASISRSKLDMLRKNYLLYSEYTVAGRPLRLKRFGYLISYVYLSLVDRFTRACY